MKKSIYVPLILFSLFIFGCTTITDVATLNVSDVKTAAVRVDSRDIYLAKLYEEQGLDLSKITTELVGMLYKPQGTGPFPAMVIMHGCSGVLPAQHEWASWLRERAVVALVIDGFDPRGYSEICTELYSTKITPSKRMSDAYGGAKLLASLPFVDRNKIGLMGNSNGGSTTLKAIHKRSQELLSKSTPQFAFAIALYPECAGAQGSKVGPSYAPVMILIGEDDDWTLAETCRRGVTKTQTHSIPATIRVYPGASHAFDGSASVILPNARNKNSPSGFGASVRPSLSATKSARADTEIFMRRLGMIE